MAAVRATEQSVVIAGGGPTGLMLAAELALAAVEVVVIEPRADQDLEGLRAGGLHARTIEVLDQRGVADRFLEAGQTFPFVGYSYNPLDIGDVPTRHPYLLALWQRDTERILADWVDELGVPVLRGRAVIGFAQDREGVAVELSDGTTLRTAYLVGCDGGRSRVRKIAGIEFPGLDPSSSWVMGEVEMREQPEIGTRPEGGGIGPVDGGEDGRYRVVVREAHVERDHHPTFDDLRDALRSAYGSDFGAHTATHLSRFTDGSRQAASYRAERVLLAGDAAHVHPPQGGQGLNLGVQDAVNLGWKLARVVQGTSPDRLLDTYHDERHPVGARVLHNTSAQVALATPDDRHQALRETMAELLSLDEPRIRTAAMLTGLDVHYDLGEGHPLLGRRMPDLDLESPAGPTCVYALLHDARPLLLNLADPGDVDVTPDRDGVRRVDASCDGRWELPVIGEVEAPSAVLIRPDGHVAWTGALGDPDLPTAISRWFGRVDAAA